MGKKLEKSGWLRSAKHTGSLFRVVKLCLQRNGTGNVPGCTVSLQRFCQEVFVILPMAQDTDTGLTAGCPPPKATSVCCQVCRLPALTVCPFSSPHPAKKVLLHQQGQLREEQIMGAVLSPSSCWGQSQEGRIHPGLPASRALGDDVVPVTKGFSHKDYKLTTLNQAKYCLF